MDAKITLRFSADTISKAKQFADANNMSLSRLTEFLYQKITSNNYQSIEDLPIAQWVNAVAEGDAEYITKKRSRKEMKDEFYKAKSK